MPLMGQQHYHSHQPRRNSRNGEKGSGDPPSNGIPIALVQEMLVSMAPQGMVMVVIQIIFMEVAQIIPFPLNLEDDIDMINVLYNMSSLNKV